MRIFTFWLMLTVAVVGVSLGYRFTTGTDLIPFPSFGFNLPAASSASAASAVRPTPVRTATAVPTATPTVTRATATPVPTPEPTKTMYIANTDGRGAYVRREAKDGDRIRAWNEGTEMTALGEPVEGEGQMWRKVKTPSGEEGYIPEKFLSEERPVPVSRSRTPEPTPSSQETPSGENEAPRP